MTPQELSSINPVSTSKSAIRSPRLPRGVTVLEVLISIGVATIGLLGVILLIPLADHQMNRGFVLERANQVGSNAFREFDIRGMDNFTNWRELTGGTPAVITPSIMANDPGDPDRPSAPAYRRAFCLDPRFVAMNGATTSATYDASLFPYVIDSSVSIFSMPRITLPAVSGVMAAMDIDQADSIFVSEDDLTFYRSSDDRTAPPLQLDRSGTDKNNPQFWRIADSSDPSWPHANQRVRAAAGRLSWMATIVPHEKVGPNGDEYILSVVVFHQRDASFTMDGGADSANERVVQIPVTGSYNGFLGGGVGGGDVALMPRNAGLSLDDAERELDLRAGDWIMLSRPNRYASTDDIGNAITREAPQSHRWYRVLAADSELTDSDAVTNAPPDSWIRFVTLDGPDWPSTSGTQVTIVKNVVAVFEKTVRLEVSSLWTN